MSRLEGVLKKRVPLWIVLLVVVASASVTYAILITTSTVRIGLWEYVIDSPYFDIENVSIDVIGKNKVDVEVTISNTKPPARKALVTVQLLDENGDVILKESAETGMIPPGGTWTHTYIFEKTGITEEFVSVFIVVKEIS